METETNPDLYRFAYTFDQIWGTDNVSEIRGGRDGRYGVELTEDAEYQDMGSSLGEALVKAGYALVGVHQHYTEGNRIDKYTFVDIDSVDERPAPDHFMDGLHYDHERDVFTSELPNAEGE